MTDKELIRALRCAVVETGSLLCLGCSYEHNCSIHGCAIIRTAAERLEALSNPPNEALTLEQLREMDGEPVWLQVRDSGRYDILTGITVYGLAQFYTAALTSKQYGKTWLAYRYKPEKAQFNET